MKSDGRTPLLLLTLSIAAVGIQALMLSPLLTDIAAGLGTQATSQNQQYRENSVVRSSPRISVSIPSR